MPRRRLLVIEDDTAIADLICRVAEGMGMEARQSCRVDEIEALHREFRPEIIALDVMMPESDGFEVLKLLNHEHCTASVIVVSGDAHFRPMAFRMGESLSVNVVGVLAKPFRLNEMRIALAEIIDSLDARDREQGDGSNQSVA